METPDPKYKHKPSEKHTLEEVLKSLQDLIRNDLSESTAGTSKPDAAAEARHPDDTSPKAPEPRLHRESAPSVREDFAPVSPGSGTVNLDAVMRSLKDLIGNELDVGDEPGPANEKSASTHEEYLSAGEKIEEYIPEELAELDDELYIGDEHAADETESTPSRDELPAPEKIIEENLPEEFTPLDEELTFETPLEPEPAPAALLETTEFPGEISPELIEEPGSPPPVAFASPPAPEKDIAPGTQQELFLEDARRHAPESEAVTTDSAPAIATEPAPADKRDQSMEAKQEGAAEALPTIEVEEGFDDNDYFAATPSGETPPPASEETIVLDAEISPEPEIVAPPVAEAAAPPEPAEITAAPAPAEPAVEKITLEAVSEPTHEKPRDKYSVDFDSSDLTPPLPDEPVLAPPETGTAMQSETPAEEIAEAAAPPLEPPAVETKAETPAETESPQPTMETAASEAPASFNLDDIPVLNEVVAPPAGGVPAAEPTAPSPEAPLPAPDRAREIVVRAVAKLNVEMRKSGSAGLDTRTILRLQQLIRQELEKGGEK